MRVARTDTTVAGTPIAEGEMLFVMIGAANRDASVFTNPERVDFGRWPNPHVGFGHGIHFCIGATTARLEARIALEELLRLAPDYQVTAQTDQLAYAPSFFLRGLEHLPIEPRSRAHPTVA